MTFGIRVSFISQIMFLVFRQTKGNSLCVFILWPLSMRLHPMMNERQLTYIHSLKNYFDFFGIFSLGPNHGRRFASPLTHTWLIGSEVISCLSHLVMIERGEREMASPTSTILYFLLTTIVRCLLLAIIVGSWPPSPTIRQMYSGVIFPRHSSHTNMTVQQKLAFISAVRTLFASN